MESEDSDSGKRSIVEELDDLEEPVKDSIAKEVPKPVEVKTKAKTVIPVNFADPPEEEIIKELEKELGPIILETSPETYKEEEEKKEELPPVPPPEAPEEKEEEEETIVLSKSFGNYWLITDELLEEIHNDLMIVIDQTDPGDIIEFVASKVVKPSRTLNLPHDLIFIAGMRYDPKTETKIEQTLTCPDEGPLIVNK